MVTKFKRATPYTLCLARETKDGDFDTFCINVTYVTRGDDYIYFKTDEYKITVDVLNHEVTFKCGGVPATNTIYCTNIVEGWQF